MSYVTCPIHLYALPHNRHLINLQEAKIWWVIFPHTNLSGYSCFAMASPILTINLFISKCFQKGPRSNQTRICYNNDPFMHSRTQSFPVAFFLIHIIFYYSCWREICHSPLRHGAPNTVESVSFSQFSQRPSTFSYFPTIIIDARRHKSLSSGLSAHLKKLMFSHYFLGCLFIFTGESQVPGRVGAVLYALHLVNSFLACLQLPELLPSSQTFHSPLHSSVPLRTVFCSLTGGICSLISSKPTSHYTVGKVLLWKGIERRGMKRAWRGGGMEVIAPDGDRQGWQYTEYRTGQWICRGSTASWLCDLGPIWAPWPYSVKELH